MSLRSISKQFKIVWASSSWTFQGLCNEVLKKRRFFHLDFLSSSVFFGHLLSSRLDHYKGTGLINHMQVTTLTNATFWIFEGPCYGKWTLLNQVLVFWYTICTCGLQIAIFQMLRLFHISKKSYSHTFQNNLERKVFKYNQLTQTFWKTLSFWMIAAS